MIFQEKKVTLKNGIIATLKTPETQDAQMLLENIKSICQETKFLARYKEDWDNVTVDSEKKWILDNRESANSLVIACYVDGEIIGNCDIRFLNDSKTFHRAVIGIAIRKKFQNNGVGSLMFEEMLRAAENHEGTEIVELEYMQDNIQGKALYEKFGFKETSVIPKACKFKDGSYQNLVYMQKEIKR